MYYLYYAWDVLGVGVIKNWGVKEQTHDKKRLLEKLIANVLAILP